MKIEHWHCRTNYGAEQLDYSNLLGACMGNEGSPARISTVILGRVIGTSREIRQIRCIMSKIWSGSRGMDELSRRIRPLTANSTRC